MADGKIRTYHGNFAYWMKPGNWAKEILSEETAATLSNLGLALGMRTDKEDLGSHETYRKGMIGDWKNVFKAKPPVDKERNPQTPQAPASNGFPGLRYDGIDPKEMRAYILNALEDGEDHSYDFERMKDVAESRGYRLDFTLPMKDLIGEDGKEHPEMVYRDRKVIYIANDIGGPATWATLIAHALGHDSAGDNESDAQGHAARLTAELYGEDSLIARASRELLSYMEDKTVQ